MTPWERKEIEDAIVKEKAQHEDWDSIPLRFWSGDIMDVFKHYQIYGHSDDIGKFVAIKWCEHLLMLNYKDLTEVVIATRIEWAQSWGMPDWPITDIDPIMERNLSQIDYTSWSIWFEEEKHKRRLAWLDTKLYQNLSSQQ